MLDLTMDSMILAVVATCAGLSGTFSVVPVSAGAGNIVYALQVHNGGLKSCVLPGLPKVQLLDAKGKALPTRVVWDRRRPVRKLVLLPHRTATATARFSPDVPPGCGRGAVELRMLSPALTARIRPPTRVCQGGRLQFSSFH